MGWLDFRFWTIFGRGSWLWFWFGFLCYFAMQCRHPWYISYIVRYWWFLPILLVLLSPIHLIFNNTVLPAIDCGTELDHQIMLVILIKIIISFNSHFLFIFLAIILIALINAYDLLFGLHLHLRDLHWFWMLLISMCALLWWIWIGLRHWLQCVSNITNIYQINKWHWWCCYSIK